jgi:hypothetical protein
MKYRKSWDPALEAVRVMERIKTQVHGCVARCMCILACTDWVEENCSNAPRHFQQLFETPGKFWQKQQEIYDWNTYICFRISQIRYSNIY